MARLIKSCCHSRCYACSSTSVLTFSTLESPLNKLVMDVPSDSVESRLGNGIFVLTGLASGVLFLISSLLTWFQGTADRRVPLWRSFVGILLILVAIIIVTLLPEDNQRFVHNIRHGFLFAVLCGCAGALVVRRFDWNSQTDARLDGVPQFLRTCDSLLVIFAIGTFLLAVPIASLWPDAYFNLGDAGPTWLSSGALASLGIIGALGLFHRASWLRVAAALLLLGCACYLFAFAPDATTGGKLSKIRRVVAIAPLVLGAGYFVIQFRLARFKRLGVETENVSSILRPAMLLTIGVLFFAVPNWLQPMAGMERIVLAYDLDSGEQLWERTVLHTPLEAKHPVNTYATPTPCVQDDRVIAHFGFGTVCLDSSGNVLWKRLDESYGPGAVYGAASSPIIYKNTVIVTQSSEKAYELAQSSPEKRPRSSYLVALDVQSGSPVWQVDVEERGDSYATPIVVRDKDLVTRMGWCGDGA